VSHVGWVVGVWGCEWVWGDVCVVYLWVQMCGRVWVGECPLTYHWNFVTICHLL